MSIIGKFLARMRREKFAANISREIYHKIFPHMNGHADHGYPFTTDDELHKARLQGSIEMWKKLRELDSAALQMPDAECNAFLFIVNRDLEERIRMYLKFAHARKVPGEFREVQPATAA